MSRRANGPVAQTLPPRNAPPPPDKVAHASGLRTVALRAAAPWGRGRPRPHPPIAPVKAVEYPAQPPRGWPVAGPHCGPAVRAPRHSPPSREVGSAVPRISPGRRQWDRRPGCRSPPPWRATNRRAGALPHAWAQMSRRANGPVAQTLPPHKRSRRATCARRRRTKWRMPPACARSRCARPGPGECGPRPAPRARAAFQPSARAAASCGW
jgi:hypothetical protein